MTNTLSEDDPNLGKLKPIVSQAELDVLKRKYGKIYLIEVEGEAGNLRFLFKRPNMKIMAMVAKFEQNDPVLAGQKLFENCLLKGDVKYKDDVEVFPAIMEQLNLVIKTRKAKIKEL